MRFVFGADHAARAVAPRLAGTVSRAGAEVVAGR
jgi:hypothetical protein